MNGNTQALVPAPSSSRCTITLPADFRVRDILEFHSRDAHAIAETVEGSVLHKGLTWQDKPACLAIRFHGGYAEAELAVDESPVVEDTALLKAMVSRMLGLTQKIEEFEQAYRDHPQMGPLIARQRGLRVPLSATPFEALTWAVTGQQISVNAATSLRRKLIQTVAVKHSGGLACYPNAGRVACLSPMELRHAGFSQTKAQTLITLSRMVEDGELPLDSWCHVMPPVEEIHQQLLRIRGIGPWTVGYALLRGFGWLDGSLHGDAAVRRGMQTLRDLPEKVSEEQAKQWLADFSPWRALVAAHLWALNAEHDERNRTMPSHKKKP